MTITSCGNFAVAGMSTGHIELFNMQSGLHRGELGCPRGGCGLLQSLIISVAYKLRCECTFRKNYFKLYACSKLAIFMLCKCSLPACDVILSHMHSGHSGPVRGVAVDSLNMEVFSGSGDGTIKVCMYQLYIYLAHA